MNTVITCHRNADFDALAALVGASLLYPGASLVFPGSQESALQQFFEDVVQHFYDFVNVRELDPEQVERVVLVDTRQRDRVPQVEAFLDKPGVLIEVWDHHPDSPNDVKAAHAYVANVGATATLISQALKERNIAVSCQTATVLGMGIYGDTGSFSFVSTTKADFEAAAWLLEQGMDLNTVAGFLRHDMSRDQVMALNDLLESAEIHEMRGHTVVVATAHSESYVQDFATLASRFMDMQPCDVFFGLGAMEDKIQVVARSRTDSINVGKICTVLGGGGHVYAASASVKNKSLPEVKDSILFQLSLQVKPGKSAGELMSHPAVGVDAHSSIDNAVAIMGRYGLKASPIFKDDSHVCVGWLEYQLAVRAQSHGLGHSRVADYMQRNFQVVQENADLQSLMDIIVGSRQRLVPVVSALPPPAAIPIHTDFPDIPLSSAELAQSLVRSNQEIPVQDRPVIGVVTRTDLIRMFMDEGEIRLPQPKQQRNRERNVAKMLRMRVPASCVSILELVGHLGTHLKMNVYVVGGFVRDLLLDQKSRTWPDLDLDLVVEGSASKFAKALAQETGGRVSEHVEFLTALVIFTNADGVEHRVDVATARLEYYERPAAMPTVELSSIKMDLYRRDFTINAMAVKLNEESFGLLVDFFDGQTDIKHKHIRMLHALSFVEDPTRALRAVRFEQRYGFRIGAQCERLIRNALELQLMDKLSGSRIVHELDLILDERNALACFQRMQDFSMLSAICPELDLPVWKAELLERVLDVLDWYAMLYLKEKPDRLVILLLALCRNASFQELNHVLDRLALLPTRREGVLQVRASVMDTLPKLDRWQNEHRQVSELCTMLSNMPLEGLLYLVARVEDEELRKNLTLYVYKWRLDKPDINGTELTTLLAPLGIKPGPPFGLILKKVLAAKRDGLANTKDEQLALALDIAQTLK